MNFKVEMTYDDKMMKDFYKFHYLKFSNTTFVISALMIIAGIVLLFFNWIYGVLACVVAVGTFFLPKYVTVSSLNQNKRMLVTEDALTFTKTKVHVYSERLGEVLFDEDMNYSDFIYVKDYKDYLYLYMTKQSALILLKSKVTKREADFIKEAIRDAQVSTK